MRDMLVSVQCCEFARPLQFIAAFAKEKNRKPAGHKSSCQCSEFGPRLTMMLGCNKQAFETALFLALMTAV